MEVEPDLRVVNIYAQPEQKMNIIKQLITRIKKIEKIEPGVEFIIAGDMNTDFRE